MNYNNTLLIFMPYSKQKRLYLIFTKSELMDVKKFKYFNNLNTYLNYNLSLTSQNDSANYK